ncbi:response regulator transcription factor [Aliidiomarina celeris]|uniref:response regulator transcription factor n=1 Tax=Aliidiomarina celeris TaxID=2249428 RepID=UPI000DEBCB16|nr:response regulator transcription factor [Aliidiomarina celeris]
MRNVVIAMPDGVIRSGVCQQLSNNQWSVVSVANQSSDVLQALHEYPQALVIVSENFDSEKATGTVHLIYREFPYAKVLVWTQTVAMAVNLRTRYPQILGHFFRTVETEELLRGCQLVNLKQKFYSPKLAIAFKRFRDNSEESRIGMGLSRREKQIFSLVCLGMTVQQIAEQLCISRKTVNTFRYRIFDKLGVTSDVQLAHIAIKNGLIEPQADLHFA